MGDQLFHGGSGSEIISKRSKGGAPGVIDDSAGHDDGDGGFGADG